MCEACCRASCTDNEKQALLPTCAATVLNSRKITPETTAPAAAGSKSISVEVRKKKVVERSAGYAETAKRQADNDARREASVAAQLRPGRTAVLFSAPVSVVAAAPVEERKKDELRRPDKPRNEDAECAIARTPPTVRPCRLKKRCLRHALHRVPPTKKATASVVVVVARAS